MLADDFDKATRRPWKAEINQSETLAQIYGDGGKGNWVLNLEHQDIDGLPVKFDAEALANLALIVRAVNAYEPMLAGLEKVRARITEIGMTLPGDGDHYERAMRQCEFVPVPIGTLRECMAAMRVAEGKE